MKKAAWVGLGALALLGVALARREKAAPADGGARDVGDIFEAGKASWYGPGYEGNLTANGEIFDPDKMTAAHKTLRFNKRVRVTDTSTGRFVEVRINDRGPFVAGRIIDLSEAAAEALGIKDRGVADVELRIIS